MIGSTLLACISNSLAIHGMRTRANYHVPHGLSMQCYSLCEDLIAGSPLGILNAKMELL